MKKIGIILMLILIVLGYINISLARLDEPPISTNKRSGYSVMPVSKEPIQNTPPTRINIIRPQTRKLIEHLASETNPVEQEEKVLIREELVKGEKVLVRTELKLLSELPAEEKNKYQPYLETLNNKLQDFNLGTVNIDTVKVFSYQENNASSTYVIMTFENENGQKFTASFKDNNIDSLSLWIDEEGDENPLILNGKPVEGIKVRGEYIYKTKSE